MAACMLIFILCPWLHAHSIDFNTVNLGTFVQHACRNFSIQLVVLGTFSQCRNFSGTFDIGIRNFRKSSRNFPGTLLQKRQKHMQSNVSIDQLHAQFGLLSGYVMVSGQHTSGQHTSGQKPDKNGPSRTRPDRPGQTRTDPDRPCPDRTRPDKGFGHRTAGQVPDN